MAETKKAVPKPVTINDVEMRALLLRCARLAVATNNSTDETNQKLVDFLFKDLTIGG